MRRLFTIFYIALATALLTGCGADSAMKKGDKFYALGEYYDAAAQYKTAYAQTPTKERKLRGQRDMHTRRADDAGVMGDCTLPEHYQPHHQQN